ncbi:hypothetical protein DESME_09150 [Desulfitobacterium metallireducens DSM 15288]|uniref:Uncharacterized protein n=1 Tax=Desulfitobacterium metallireducens DSM 15288 TaxID=871968 RepID=W0ECI6_9FIRM|nr:hypothetical protein DESME_09150 [Desulfitobacterium metallireducens DSM 15288]
MYKGIICIIPLGIFKVFFCMLIFNLKKTIFKLVEDYRGGCKDGLISELVVDIILKRGGGKKCIY